MSYAWRRGEDLFPCVAVGPQPASGLTNAVPIEREHVRREREHSGIVIPRASEQKHPMFASRTLDDWRCLQQLSPHSSVRLGEAAPRNASLVVSIGKPELSGDRLRNDLRCTGLPIPVAIGQSMKLRLPPLVGLDRAKHIIDDIRAKRFWKRFQYFSHQHACRHSRSPSRSPAPFRTTPTSSCRTSMPRTGRTWKCTCESFSG